VSLSDVEAAVCTWLESRPAIVSLEPNALSDIWADIRRVAEALEASEHGDALIRGLQVRIAAIKARADQLGIRPTVACIEWPDPLMAAGNWMPELIELAGGQDIFGKPGTHAPAIAWESVLEADPDVMFVSPCGWDIEKARSEMPALTTRPGWSRLSAVQHGRVYLADGNQFFNRPGPRLVESLEILAEILHPGEFDFGHAGRNWVPFDGQ
jgi:iron complex transport system substrate-binding protein